MRVIWKGQAGLRPHAGHGFDFFAEESMKPASLLAVLRGFEWLHSHAEEVEILIRPPDDAYDETTLAAARMMIEDFMQRPLISQGHLLGSIYMWPNT